MHRELKGALGAFLFSAAYLLAPVMVVVGAVRGDITGYSLCALALLWLSVGHVMVTQASAPTTRSEALLEVLFWCAASSALIPLFIFVLSRSWFALLTAVTLVAVATVVWRGSSSRTKARIRKLPLL